MIKSFGLIKLIYILSEILPVPKDLSVRIHRCPSCGLVMDRDQVSAILIKNRSSTAGIAGIQAQLSNLNREAMTWEAPCESKG
jgi:transposase